MTSNMDQLRAKIDHLHAMLHQPYQPEAGCSQWYYALGDAMKDLIEWWYDEIPVEQAIEEWKARLPK